MSMRGSFAGTNLVPQRISCSFLFFAGQDSKSQWSKNVHLQFGALGRSIFTTFVTIHCLNDHRMISTGSGAVKISMTSNLGNIQATLEEHFSNKY